MLRENILQGMITRRMMFPLNFSTPLSHLIIISHINSLLAAFPSPNHNSSTCFNWLKKTSSQSDHIQPSQISNLCKFCTLGKLVFGSSMWKNVKLDVHTNFSSLLYNNTVHVIAKILFTPDPDLWCFFICFVWYMIS